MKKLIALGMALLATTAFAANRVGPVSQYGQLQAGKNNNGQGRIYGSCPSYSTSGNEVQVQGMSLFWSISSDVGSPFWTADYISGLVSRQNIQLIRAPMGVDENWGSGNYFSNKGYYQGLMNTVVQAAIDNDIYVIIDYHSHKATNSVDNAKTFFSEMAQKWGKYDNVIFEIFNEPTDQSWNEIKSYANDVVKTIRQYSDNLILVGNPSWDQHPEYAVNNEVTDSQKNIAYTFHFYAGSHSLGREGSQAVSAMNSGLPVFVSEWGTVNADGDGAVSGNASGWVDWMNQHKLSGANWAVSNKNEGASYFSGSAWNYSNSGKWVNENVFAKLSTSYKPCSGSSPSSSSSIASSSSVVLPAGYTDYIDDFEDGDSLAFTGGIWYAYTDAADNGASTISNAKVKDRNGEDGYDVVLTADNESRNMAGMTGIRLSQGGNEYEPYVALGVKFNANESAYDLSACNTISYKYKGAGHNFKVETTGVIDYGYHQVVKSDADSWTMVTLSWDMLNQPSWADEVTLNKKNVTKFTWEVKGDMKGTQPKKNFLSVDDVRCVGWSTKPFVPSSSSVARSSSSIVPSSSSVTPSSSSIAPSSSSIAFSSSSVQQSSSSIVRSSSSSVILSSSSSAKSSSSVAPSSSSVIPSSSSVVPSSSSVAPSSSSVAPSSSSVAPVEYKIIGNLEQSVAKGAEIDLITVTGVKSFTRDSYMAYFLDAVVSNGTLTIFGKVPEFFYLEGLVTEKFTVNGERIELKLTVLALVSSSSGEPPQSSSSEETVTSSSSVLPESSSSVEEPPMCMPVATLDKLGFSYARNTLSILGVRGTINIQVFDLMGHFVKEFVANSLLGEVQFDLNVLPKGNYLVRYTANAVAKTARIAVR
jgi:hypothetical protein